MNALIVEPSDFVHLVVCISVRLFLDTVWFWLNNDLKVAGGASKSRLKQVLKP
jgi:hypothetical protein